MAWNRSDGVTASAARRGRGGAAAKRRLWIAAATVAAVASAAVAAWLFLGGSEGESEPAGRDAPHGKIAAAKPSRGAAAERGGRAARRGGGEPLPRTRKDVAPPAPLEEILDVAAQNGAADGEQPKDEKPMFEPGTDQILSMAIPSEPGAGVPPIPFPDGADYTEEMKKSLGRMIEVGEDDSEETLKRKIQVAEHKLELGELAEEGWTLQEYANAIRERYIEANDFLAECHKLLEKAYADESLSDNEYISMRDAVNVKLKERGLPEIKAYAETELEDELAKAENAEGKNGDTSTKEKGQ